MGNPVVMGIAVIWRIEDVAKAVFAMDDYQEFLSMQPDARKMIVGGAADMVERALDELHRNQIVSLDGLEIKCIWFQVDSAAVREQGSVADCQQWYERVNTQLQWKIIENNNFICIFTKNTKQII